MIFYLFPSSLFFSDFTFYKEALCFIIFILSLFSNTLTLKSMFEYIRQKGKNILTLKIHHPKMKCLHVFFSSFIPGWNFHSCIFDRDEFIPGWNSSRQKRVNSKRHFTIYRDDFIPGQVSSRDEISRVNTLSVSLKIYEDSMDLTEHHFILRIKGLEDGAKWNETRIIFICFQTRN